MEYKNLDRYDPTTEKMVKGGGERIMYFQWAQLSPNQYLVVLPKLFKVEAGDTYVIVSPKKFLKLLNDK